jgi:hypothetical protein
MMVKNPNERIDANYLIKYLNDNFNYELEIKKLSIATKQMNLIEK